MRSGIGITLPALGVVCWGGWIGPASAQVGGESCLAPAAFSDADVIRHAAELANPILCLSMERVEENGISWMLTVVRNRERSGPLWAVPHDEEDEAFASGVYAVLRHGGTMVAVENSGDRLVDGLDPNHIFAVTKSAAEVCKIKPAPAYVAAFLENWDRAQPVIGLHSNWDGYQGAGGLGTISVRLADDKMIPFPSEVAVGRLADEDTIVMLVSARLPAENSAGQETIAWFNDHGLHVIYRHVTEENNGCTLADYLTLNRLGAYFNLEVEHGDTETQPQMIDRVMEFIRSDAYPGAL